ncbi:Glycerophosphocholine phosphodiesterase, partial [Lunasporangiospora selenospora]
EVEKANCFFVYKRSELERRLRILTEKSRRIHPNIATTGASAIAAAVEALPIVTLKQPPVARNATGTGAGAGTGTGAGSRSGIVTPTAAIANAPQSAAGTAAPLVPPSPFISDPEIDAECLEAMVKTKEHLLNLSWFAEMNRRAVEKILKKFDKRMITISRDGYLATKVNVLPFVTDGRLRDITRTTETLIQEMRNIVAEYPPPRLGLSPPLGGSKARLGFTDEQIHIAMEAIERDDLDTLSSIIYSRLKEKPELKEFFQASVQVGNIGQLPRTLFRKALEERAFKCIALMMSFGVGTLMVNVNEQTILHKLAIDGGAVTKFDTDLNTSTSTLADQNNGEAEKSSAESSKDDPTLITFILQQLSTRAAQDSLCTLKSTPDIFGRRPLHYAAMYGYPNVARALMHDLKASGEFIDFANPYWLDTDGFTPLIYAVSRGQAAVLQVLMEEGGISDADAVCNAFSDQPSLPKIMPTTPMTVLNPLVGAEANLHAAYTYTPLSIACRLGHIDVARLLIQYGANLDSQDEDGETPLIIAAKNGHVGCARLLITGTNGKGANLELRERYYGWTALHLAAIENHPDVVSVLLQAGANPNVYDFSSWNPHEHAVFAANNVCAQLLRPVTLSLDARQRLLKVTSANLDHSQSSSPTRTTPDALTTPPGSPSPSATQVHRPDSPPASGGKNSVKTSKAVHRAYGHKYLENESMIIITLGSNDIRCTVEPVELYTNNENMIENSFLTASTAFSLEITSENATAGEKAIIDLPLKDSSYHDKIVFYATNPEETVFDFLIYPTFGQSSDKLIGRGSAMLSSLDNLRKDVRNQHPTLTSLQGMNMTVPIFSADTMKIIGRVRVEFTVVRPFKHENLKVGSKHTYWKSLTTTVIGHRGLGMNRKVSHLQVGENTLLSFVTAASLGAEYVEFDVQMTKDMVPVLYHDWTVTETGLDIPVSSVTLDQFRGLSCSGDIKPSSSGPSSPRMGTPTPQVSITSSPPSSTSSDSMSAKPSEPNGATVSLAASALEKPKLVRSSSGHTGSELGIVLQNSASSSPNKEPVRLVRSNSLGAISRVKSLSSVAEPAHPPGKMKGNGLGTIRAPFATLKDTFETVPTNIGFNIEVKYPMLDEAEEANIPLYSFEMNRFVDRILQEVYDHDKTHPDRHIIFSSFHPDICLLLNMKQPNYPVFFLTDGGTTVMADRRCNSIQGAVRFATSTDLLGIVTASPPIIEAPNLVKGIKQSGLLVFTYGADNNDVENAKLQRRHGVDAVIVDSVLAVRKGLQQEEA